MLLPVEPFQGNARVVGVQAPPLKQFVDNRVSLHVVLTEIPVASRGDVNVGKGIEASQRFKYRLEGETPLLEEFDIRLALFSQLLLEVVDDVGHTLSSMPRLKVPSHRYRHDVWHEVGSVRNAPDVGLITRGVEEMQKIPILEFSETECLGKGQERHLEQVERSYKGDAIKGDLQQLGTVPQLLDNAALSMLLFNNKITIIPLEVVGQHLDILAVLLHQCVQPLQEVAHAQVSLEADWTLVIPGFGHNKIQNMTLGVLHGLHVKEYM